MGRHKADSTAALEAYAASMGVSRRQAELDRKKNSDTWQEYKKTNCPQPPAPPELRGMTLTELQALLDSQREQYQIAAEAIRNAEDPNALAALIRASCALADKMIAVQKAITQAQINKQDLVSRYVVESSIKAAIVRYRSARDALRNNIAQRLTADARQEFMTIYPATIRDMDNAMREMAKQLTTDLEND